MCAFKTGIPIYYKQEEINLKVYKYIDQLIVLFPEFQKFHIYEYIAMLEPDFEKRKKIRSIASNIREALENHEYIKNPEGLNNVHVLTLKGIAVKQDGGHFKHIRKEKRRNFLTKYLSNIISICALILAFAVAVLNWNQKKNSDEIQTKIENLQNQINSLKSPSKVR